MSDLILNKEFSKLWQPNMVANLVFLVKGNKILLIHKKTGLGAGKINGPGGKREKGESELEGAIREVREELLITPIGIEKRGNLYFNFVDGLKLYCSVFYGNSFIGVPKETKEAKPQWFEFDNIPFNKMWEDDLYWLPQLLKGKKVNAWFNFKDEKMLSYQVEFGDLIKI